MHYWQVWHSGKSIALTTDAPAFYLTVEAAGLRGEFDDNCFTLLPEETKRLVFTSKGEVPTTAALQQALTVRHLHDLQLRCHEATIHPCLLPLRDVAPV